jgi:hypothetical protein
LSIGFFAAWALETKVPPKYFTLYLSDYIVSRLLRIDVSNFGTVVSSTLGKTGSFCKAAGIKLHANSAVCRRRDRPVRFILKNPVITVQAAMRHLRQEIPVKKTKGWKRLQGQFGYDQIGQQELRELCHRKKY